MAKAAIGLFHSLSKSKKGGKSELRLLACHEGFLGEGKKRTSRCDRGGENNTRHILTLNGATKSRQTHCRMEVVQVEKRSRGRGFTYRVSIRNESRWRGLRGEGRLAGAPNSFLRGEKSQRRTLQREFGQSQKKKGAKKTEVGCGGAHKKKKKPH